MQNSLYKLFEHKCVLEVCVHIHPMINTHPVFFLILFSNQAVLRFLSERRSSVQAEDPYRSKLRAVHHCEGVLLLEVL